MSDEAKLGDGGPAFAMTGTDWNNPACGISVRDYFAAKAMPSIVTLVAERDDLELVRLYGAKQGDTRPQVIALASYSIADAMLAARSAVTK